MNLYFLRHGIAEDRNPAKHKDDSQRALTDEGIEAMRLEVKAFKALKLDFDHILSSPYLRARQTAEITAEGLGIKKRLKFSDHLACGGDPKKLVKDLATNYYSKDNILLVGHEPYLGDLIGLMISGSAHASIQMKKGGLCKVAVEYPAFALCGTLKWLLTPNQLIKLGEK